MARAEGFGGRLRELRESARLTQAELAEKAELTREGVAQLETGRRKPAWETVLALCEALGVECTAFCQAPAGRLEPQRGRPRKAPPEEAPAVGQGAKRRPRRRPKEE
jgi:transcriptional regulator with XRE-family HTH domain